MNAAVLKLGSPTGKQWYLHVDPSDVGMVTAAAGGNGFRWEHVGYATCPVEDHDGRCVCYDGDDQ